MATLGSQFLAESNLAGQTLLALVSRGNAILAELQRLSGYVPAPFLRSAASSGSLAQHEHIILDFRYFKAQEYYDHVIDADPELLDLDEQFRDLHLPLLERFYRMFESIYKFASDFDKYLTELDNGVFIQHTFESVLMNADGKQLVCEALYLYGCMMLLMDELIDGPVRERLLVAYYRYKINSSPLPLIDDVCKLCRSSGYSRDPSARRPPNYPEEYLSRFKFPKENVRMIIGKLRSDDIYNQISAYPLPEHRSTALATQASMLYVILYLCPDILHSQPATMREIVDKHFPDNWVISYYMGIAVDLSVAWDPYKAAKAALNYTLVLPTLKALSYTHWTALKEVHERILEFLTEGVMTDIYILDHIGRLMHTLRQANVTVRWLMLHSTCQNRRLRDVVAEVVDQQMVLGFLLDLSQLEFKLKTVFQRLLDTKRERWKGFQDEAVSHVKELAEYFSGEKLLARTQKDERLQTWLLEIADKIASLDYSDSTTAGRKIQLLTNALEEVEQFHEIETNLQVKQFLADTRDYLHQMIRTVNTKEDVLATIQLVADMSYAWHVINDYVPLMQTRIKEDPFTTIKLRSTFLKLASVLDLPLVRILQAKSPDLESVSEYFSSELVKYVRRVLEIIPRSMFAELNDVVRLQTGELVELPTRFPREESRKWAQLDQRYALAKSTHSISVFAEGIRSMQTTLVGVIKVHPQQLLEDGIRQQLVRHLSDHLHTHLQFKPGKTSDFEQRLQSLSERLDAFSRSFEYIQDYVNIYGLKIWQEEFARIINYNVEQECNRFLKKQLDERFSQYQSEVIPIPTYASTDGVSVNFIGRVARELIAMTDLGRASYVEHMSGWFDATGRCVAGIRTFDLIQRSLSVWGTAGLDRFFSFRIAQRMQVFEKKYRAEVLAPVKEGVVPLETTLTPFSCMPGNARALYDAAINAVRPIARNVTDLLQELGHLQMIRRHISNELNFTAKIDSSSLSFTLDVLNKAVVRDIQAHYRWPEQHAYPDEKNALLSEMDRYLEVNGIHDPLAKIYIATEPLPNLAVVMFAITLSCLSRMVFKSEFGILVSRRKDEQLDGVTLAVGIGSLLHQFHTKHTASYIAMLTQYVRAMTNDAAQRERAVGSLPTEATNMLHFLELLCKYEFTTRAIVTSHLPSFIFDRFAH